MTITTTLTAIGNYYLDEKDIQEHLDIVMAVTALSYQALLGDDLYQRPLSEIQTRLDNVPKDVSNYFGNTLNIDKHTPSHYLHKFSLQILTKSGKLLLKSSSAPNIPLSNTKTGFKNTIIENKKWRVFTATNPHSGTRTVLAERYNARNELGHLITKDDLYIMLLTFPLSGFLIWFIIGRGLDSLDSIAEEVANRASNNLQPVNIKQIPKEIKPVIDELNKLFQRLQEGFDREKRFASDAAHELRTPLAALKAQAQVALKIESIDEKNIAIQKLIASVNRSAHVVQQLLTMSKLLPEAGVTNNFTKINLAKISQETLALIAPSALEKEIELEFEHDKHLPKIIGNATAISILVRNLVDNAIRYCDIGGHIWVKIKKHSDTLTLEIHDDGPGIPDELREQVFQRFFRVLGNQSQGSGLGLGIVQQICTLHNAKVTLKSPERGTGLIVTVDFPCA